MVTEYKLVTSYNISDFSKRMEECGNNGFIISPTQPTIPSGEGLLWVMMEKAKRETI